MKTSLKKLQKIAALRHDQREHKQHQSLPNVELARATQDMNDMRDCYDRLLSSAAATANSVDKKVIKAASCADSLIAMPICPYPPPNPEFSESLGEMGYYLLEKTALNDDEANGKVLLMLGNVQFELQKIVDSYTITIPSDSLLNELLLWWFAQAISCHNHQHSY